MAAIPNEFVAHCIELFSPLGAVRTRRMFGGHGFYLDELFIALIAEERLFLKTDPLTHAAFEAAGCTAFSFEGEGKTVTTSYFGATEEALESPAAMAPWARLAFEAALRARAAKKPAKPKLAKPSGQTLGPLTSTRSTRRSTRRP